MKTHRLNTWSSLREGSYSLCARTHHWNTHILPSVDSWRTIIPSSPDSPTILQTFTTIALLITRITRKQVSLQWISIAVEIPKYLWQLLTNNIGNVHKNNSPFQSFFFVYSLSVCPFLYSFYFCILSVSALFSSKCITCPFPLYQKNSLYHPHQWKYWYLRYYLQKERKK